MEAKKSEQSEIKTTIPPLERWYIFASEFAFIIAVPLLILATVGKYLESRFHNKWYVVGAVLIALLISAVWIGVIIKKLIKQQK